MSTAFQELELPEHSESKPRGEGHKFLSGVSGHTQALVIECLGAAGGGWDVPQTIHSAFRQCTWRISTGPNTGCMYCTA